MSLRSGFVAVFLGALLALAASGARASSLERFSEFITKTLTASGEFEQKIFDHNLKLLQESRGVLAFSRPGRFRWTYVKPYAQLIVGDGSRVWIYDEDLKQVTVKKLDQALGSTPAALLAGNNEAMRAFKLSDKGAKDG
ncbi:MAG TPA: outer membrane lipoprotein chaperone LolA, partial [Burkholderiales bacterium]|nr:outer membrane lipoprotein chaperone LolA [Burkholderiales bacterium]